MVENAPLISIIIPCYNTQQYISETLESVLAQTFPHFEIIAIDDGSTDNTLSILREYEQKDKRIKVITQANAFYITARINGIKIAKGKYLVCLDSDDKLAPTYLESCVNLAEKDSHLSIVYTKAMFFEKVNKAWNLPPFQLKSFLLENCIYAAALIRRLDYDRVGGFDNQFKMLEDWDLFISIIKNGGKVHRIDKPLFFYRKRHNASSVTDVADKNKHSDNQLRIFQKHYDFYKENNIFLQDLFGARVRFYERYNRLPIKLFYWLFNKRKFKKIYLE